MSAPPATARTSGLRPPDPRRPDPRRPSLRLNVLANLGGRLWTALMSFAFVPLYIRFMGIEGYGLIGVFTTMLAIFALLDLGFGMTINRELARLGADEGEASAVEAGTLLRTLELIYWAIAMLIGGTVVLAAPAIADRWLNASHLAHGDVVGALRWMGATAIVRWPIGLYMGALLGLGRQVAANTIAALGATVAGGGAVLLLAFLSPSPRAFFAWQALAATGQILAMRLVAWRRMPPGPAPRVDLLVLRRSIGFSAGVTGITLLSIVLTQVDKLLLSRLLPLAQFGSYALAGSLAGLMYIAGASIQTAVFPALTRMIAAGDADGERRLYHLATRSLAILVFPAAASLIAFAPELVFAYTRDRQVTDAAVPVIRVLAAGNGVLAIMCLPYSLQLAHGWTRLSIVKNVLAVPIYVPLLFVLVGTFGPVGAAIAWLALTLGYLTIEVPVMHRRLLTGSLWRWYGQDVVAPALVCAAIFAVARVICTAIGGLWTGVAGAFAAATCSVVVLALLVGPVRTRVLGMLASLPGRPMPDRLN